MKYQWKIQTFYSRNWICKCHLRIFAILFRPRGVKDPAYNYGCSSLMNTGASKAIWKSQISCLSSFSIHWNRPHSIFPSDCRARYQDYLPLQRWSQFPNRVTMETVSRARWPMVKVNCCVLSIWRLNFITMISCEGSGERTEPCSKPYWYSGSASLRVTTEQGRFVLSWDTIGYSEKVRLVIYCYISRQSDVYLKIWEISQFSSLGLKQNGQDIADEFEMFFVKENICIQIAEFGFEGIMHVNIGSDNGLVPDSHQAITWTNVDQDVWHYSA